MKKETSAGAIVFFQKGKTREYLVLNYLGGHWDFPKGHIELHEKPEETVLREIKEETGLDIIIIKGFQEKITYTFRHRNEFIIKDVIFYLAKARNQKVKLSEEHKGYVWLPFKSALQLITFNKDLLKKVENFLNKRKEGFSLIEILVVLTIILVLFGITSQIFKPSSYLQRSRDAKRIGDLKALDLALKTYLTSTSSPNLGPINKGVDETNPTIFISVPFNKEDIRNQNLIWGGKTYYFSQVSSTEYFKNDSNGWIPINLAVLPYPPIFALPTDPLNSYNKRFFYSYVFKRASSTFEINANLEFQNFKYGGSYDQTNTDGGDNQYIYEVGNSLILMPNNLY